MAKNIHTTYYEDNYVRYKCYDCEKSFIVGEELSKNCNLSCPYCSSENIDWESRTDDDSIEQFDMGCIGIYFDKFDLIPDEMQK